METQCIDDHQLKKNDFEVVGELVLSAHRSCCKAYILPDLVELTCCGQVTRSQEQSLKWNRAFDQRLAQLTSLHSFHELPSKTLLCCSQFQVGFAGLPPFDFDVSLSVPQPKKLHVLTAVRRCQSYLRQSRPTFLECLQSCSSSKTAQIQGQ